MIDFQGAKITSDYKLISQENAKFYYIYDLDWEHEVIVEKIMPPEAGVQFVSMEEGPVPLKIVVESQDTRIYRSGL
jgi:hypothetical protein